MSDKQVLTFSDQIKENHHVVRSVLGYILSMLIILSYPIVALVFGASRSSLDNDVCQTGASWLFVMGIFLLVQRVLYILALLYTAYKSDSTCSCWRTYEETDPDKRNVYTKIETRFLINPLPMVVLILCMIPIVVYWCLGAKEFFSSDMIECRNVHPPIYRMMLSLLVIMASEFTILVGLYGHSIKTNTSFLKRNIKDGDNSHHVCRYILLAIFLFLMIFLVLVSYPIAAIVLAHDYSPESNITAESNSVSNSSSIYNPCELDGISMSVQTLLKVFGYTAIPQRFVWLLSLVIGSGLGLSIPNDVSRGSTLKSIVLETGGSISMIVLALFFIPMIVFWGYAIAMLTNENMDKCSDEYPVLRIMLFVMIILQAVEFVPLVGWGGYIIKKTFT